MANALRAVDRGAEAGDALGGQLDAQREADVHGRHEDDGPEFALAGPDEAGADVADERRSETPGRLDDVALRDVALDPFEGVVVDERADLEEACHDGSVADAEAFGLRHGGFLLAGAGGGRAFYPPDSHGAGRFAKNASSPWRHSSVSRGAAEAWAASSMETDW